MDWEQLLGLSVRLLDAHDSGHSPGAATPVVNEDRAGRMDGLWLNMATELLEYLNEYEAATNESWVPLDEFLCEMSDRHNVTEDDVRWVVNLLSTPTRLTTISVNDVGDVAGTSSTKATALVERPRYKTLNKCRLTRQGRIAVKLAKGVQGVLYSQYDAMKIILALHQGDFLSALNQADAVNQEVRGFSQELTRLLEQPVSLETREAYNKQKDAYLDAIQSVDKTAEQALVLFNTTGVKESFSAWAEEFGPSAPSEAAFRERLRDTVRSVNSLSGHMRSMIGELVSAEREVVGNVDFTRVAIQLVFSPPNENELASAIMSLGPWAPTSILPDASDLLGILPPTNDTRTFTDLTFDEAVLDSESQTILVDFLTTYGPLIRETLRSGQSVSLTKAISEGLVEINNQLALSELVGVYVSPDWLQMDDVVLRVGFKNNGLNMKLPDGGQLWGDELILEAVPREGEG
ncbi:MAG: hypothetical protein AB2598_11015 [Candidatus Thiodiazotropha sp.]